MEQLSVHEKEKIEKHLLDAMKSLDLAASILYPTEMYAKETHKLVSCKATIKAVLNKEFDFLARSKSK